MDDIMDNELCFCGRTRQWHRDNETQHEFNPDALTARKAEAASKSTSEARIPSDPILRYLLIEKGVITPQDLTDAETKLKTLGSLFSSGPDSTQQSLL